jgi:alpha-galactosidase
VTRTSVTNEGDRSIVLQAVNSLTTALLRGSDAPSLDDLVLHSGTSEWLGENRWTAVPVRTHELVDLGLSLHGQDQRGRIHRRGISTWSTGTDLPVGALVDSESGWAWAWQIEHNGPWSWEIGERLEGPYIALSGPDDEDHQWSVTLQPGDTFESVPAALVFSPSGLEGVVGELTRHRRDLRSGTKAPSTLPVIFNDYMNTLEGDPTTERLLPLIDAAAEVGADIFCIDAGWYDDTSDWWDAVGDWLPSRTRFPAGIGEVIDAIRDRGMIPGLWLEPEVVGLRSSKALELPAEAFFQRSGTAVVEHGRVQLDLTHPAARAHLDEVVDRLVGDFGVGYFKLDYNITPGAGTDVGDRAPGLGLLEHNRAHLDWVDGVLTRHPGLLVENCASGAMRQDYALLGRLHIQSTSDQQDPLLYPPIAAGSLLSVLPEQAGHWSYPQPEMSREEMLFTLATGMLGRMYLSGHLDKMTSDQIGTVRDAVSAHRQLLPEVQVSTPFWPLGLPTWSQSWVAVGLHVPTRDLLTIWRRDPEPRSATLVLPQHRGRPLTIDWLLPGGPDGWSAVWDAAAGQLHVAAAGADPSARVLSLGAIPTAGGRT